MLNCMLREIEHVKQYPGQHFRRWFNDELLDLFVWYDVGGRIVGFQFCFDKDRQERALTYTDTHGYSLNKVDDGGSAWDMSSPVLVPGAEFPRVRLLAQLGERGAALDRRLFKYLIEKLEEFTSRSDFPARDSEPPL